MKLDKILLTIIVFSKPIFYVLLVDFLEESPEFSSFKLHIEDSFVTAYHLITKEEVAARFLNLIWIWLFYVNSKEPFHRLRQDNALVSSDSETESASGKSIFSKLLFF